MVMAADAYRLGSCYSSATAPARALVLGGCRRVRPTDRCAATSEEGVAFDSAGFGQSARGAIWVFQQPPGPPVGDLHVLGQRDGSHVLALLRGKCHTPVLDI